MNKHNERAELIAWLNHSADQAEMYATTSRDAKRFRRAAALLEAQRPALKTMTDEQCEELIEESGGYWKEDMFYISGPELMAMLRAAHGIKEQT